MLGRRGPGLVRVAATTAVVAGTAGAVRHRQDQKYDAKQQAAYDEQTAAQQAGYQQAMAEQQAAAPAAPSEPDPAAEIQKYAALMGQGLITAEEFEAKKKQILGI